MNTDLRQSLGWAKYLKSQGWKIEEIRGQRSEVRVYIRKIPLLGSVIKIQRPAEIPSAEEIDRIAKKNRAFLVKLEPPYQSPGYPVTRLPGFEPDPTPNLPTKTIFVDLTKSEDELWANLSQDVRQSVRKARDMGLKVNIYRTTDEDFDQALINFHDLLKETGKRRRFWTPSLPQLREKAKAFGKDTTLFLVQSGSKNPVAGALTLLWDGTHSASSAEGQRLFAPYLLLWETILYLKKKRGAKYHDLAGIHDPRYPKLTKRWGGFTLFKRKFGGREVEYPRPLVRYFGWPTKLIFNLGKLLT
ncbi:peptidoglycan bridge formation glycyltransferase FemA/FemB family protein [Candidatus Saccharibacteria bacterium]|nr:peptidoglycan bridge formation glycyltransferase FemA/FemB family protein [Candidatus Saccharibacteria bacterium]